VNPYSWPLVRVSGCETVHAAREPMRPLDYPLARQPCSRPRPRMVVGAGFAPKIRANGDPLLSAISPMPHPFETLKRRGHAATYIEMSPMSPVCQRAHDYVKRALRQFGRTWAKATQKIGAKGGYTCGQSGAPSDAATSGCSVAFCSAAKMALALAIQVPSGAANPCRREFKAASYSSAWMRLAFRGVRIGLVFP